MIWVLLQISLPPEVDAAVPRVEQARDVEEALSVLAPAVDASRGLADAWYAAQLLRGAIEVWVDRRLAPERDALRADASAWQEAAAWREDLDRLRERLTAAVASGGDMTGATDALRELWHREIVARISGGRRARFDERAAEIEAERARLHEAVNPLAEMVPDETVRPVAERMTRARYCDVIQHFLRGSERDLWRYARGIELYHREFVLPDGAMPEVVDHVQVLNEHREMLGLRVVALERRLVQAATAHSQVMHQENRIFHEGGPDGTPDERAQRFGYGGSVRENCAVSGPDGWSPYFSWVGSQGHHSNMIDPNHTVVGVGRYEMYWTQKFGNQGIPREAQAALRRVR